MIKVETTGVRARAIVSGRKLAGLKENITAYSMILPAMFFFFLFLVFPIMKSIQISLYNWSGIGNLEDFIGLENYVKSLQQPDFYASILNTFKLVIFDVTISISIGFLLAYALFKRIKGWKFFSVFLYIPSIVTVVVVGLIWRQIYETNQGLLNSILKTIGLGGLAHNWLGEFSTVMLSVIIAWVWKSIPFVMIILYAAMLGISEDMFEAARIDGASELKIISKIIIPFMVPVISLLIILTIANDFRAFDMIFVLTQGGPAYSTEISTIYVYRQASVNYEYGYANAVAIELFAIVGVIVYLFVSLLKKLGFNEND